MIFDVFYNICVIIMQFFNRMFFFTVLVECAVVFFIGASYIFHHYSSWETTWSVIQSGSFITYSIFKWKVLLYRDLYVFASTEHMTYLMMVSLSLVLSVSLYAIHRTFEGFLQSHHHTWWVWGLDHIFIILALIMLYVITPPHI